MDEKLIDQLYSYATQSRGDKRTRDQFAASLMTDTNLFNDMFNYAKAAGMVSGIDQFAVGVGKQKAGQPAASPLSQIIGAPRPIQGVSVQPQREEPILTQQQFPRTSTTPVRQQSFDQYDQYSGVDPRLMRGARPQFVAESTAAPRMGVSPVEISRFEQAVEEQVPEFVKPLVKTITPELIGDIEENVVPQMNYQFGDLGFKFEQSGAGRDRMKVTAPNGQTIDISLDPFTSETEKEEAERLTRFIKNNTIKIPKEQLQRIESQYKDSNKRFLSDAEMDEENARFAKEQDVLRNEIIAFNKLKETVDREAELYSKGMIRTQEEFDIYLKNRSDFELMQGSIQKKLSEYDVREAELARRVGAYTEMKSEQGTWYGYLWDKTLLGVGRMASAAKENIIGATIEVGAALIPSMIYSDADWKRGYLRLAEEAGLYVPKLDYNKYGLGISEDDYDKWFSQLSDDDKEKFRDKLIDEAKKQQKFTKIEGTDITLQDAVRTALVNGMGSGVSEEYRNRLDRGFISGAIGGAFESIPAFIGGGKKAAATRVVRLMMQAEDATMEEMDKNPAFKDISENEKMGVVLPIAVTTAVLENIGFRNMIANKGLLNRLTLSALGRAGATTTAKTFGDLVRNEVKSGLARGTLTIVGGALAEAETGLLQEAASIGVKELYNASKGKDMFMTPDSLAEFASDVIKAGAQEAIGGFVLGMPNAVAAANRKQGYLGMDDETFKLFETAAFNSRIQTAYVNSLKNKVASGEITNKEAKAQLNEYRNAASLLRSVPQELNTQDKKKAMNLLRERRALDQQIDGKDEALTKPQRDRINAINQELTKLSEDAVQKQAAGQVPVQPTTGVSPEVAQGTPATGSEVITDEGEKEGVSKIPPNKEEIKRISEEASNKIERKDLFDGVGNFSTQLGGSDQSAVPVSHKKINGIEFVEYAHPETGSVDVIVTGTSNNDFVGFYRLYENGKPTNRWSSKFENQSRNKDAFKTMLSGVQAMLPEDHEWTEKSSISTDGLRIWRQQLDMGYELQYDDNGNLITNLVAINGDAIANELGIPVKKGQFENISVINDQDFETVKKALLPYLQKFGLGEENIKPLSGTVKIDLPVLKPVSKKSSTATTTQTAEVQPSPATTTGTAEVQPSLIRTGVQRDMVNQAVEQMERMENDGFSENAFDATSPEPEVEVIPITITENSDLANKVRKMGLSELIGKKINLVMADQLKVGDVKAGKKTMRRMGGPLFPMIEGLFGKVAWASINKSAASSIVNGAINSDYTVVFNMNPSAIDSNLATADTFLAEVLALGKEKQNSIFTNIKEQLAGKKFGKKTQEVQELVSASKNIQELIDGISSLDTETRSDVLNNIIPSQRVKAETKIGKALQAEGITIESIRAKNVEQFASNLPAGALTVVLEVQDKSGKKVTKATRNEAIITPEQQDAEGLPKHQNYPIYIRGRAVAMLSETVPFWNILKDSLNNINVKVAQIVKQATGRPITSKQARNDEMRSASMSASRARTVTAPATTMYEKFISLISRSFPSVVVSKTQEEFDALLENLTAKKLATKDQKVYGAVFNGKLYLNPSLENYNTPIHEYGHIWMNVAKSQAKDLYDKGISLVKGSPYVQQILSSEEYGRIIKKMKADGMSQEQIDEYVREEALATAIGDKGESFVIASQKKDFKNWLNKLYSFVRKLTGISQYTPDQLENITLDEFLQAVSADLLSGRELFKGAEVKVEGDMAQLSTERTMPPIQNATVVVTGTRRGMENLASNNWNEATDAEIGDVRAREEQFRQNTFVVDTGTDPFYRRTPGTKIINYKVDAIDAVGRPGFLQVSLIVPEGQVVDNNVLKTVLDERVEAIKSKYGLTGGLNLQQVPQTEFDQISEALVDALANPPSVQPTVQPSVQPAPAPAPAPAPTPAPAPAPTPAPAPAPTPAPTPTTTAGPVESLPGYEKLMDDVVNTLIPNSLKRKLTGEQMIRLVKKFVERSAVYKKADDIQRDELVRRVNGMLGEAYKNAPSAQKILGIKKTKVQVSDELKALNDQLKLEAKAAREAKADLNTKRKQLMDAVRKMAEGGKIGAKKVAALINRIGKLNLDSQVAVNKFIDYASKVFADADYADKLNTANSTRKKIRKISKDKDKSANLRTIGEKFVEIDPSMVEDIDAYNEIASQVLESIKGSTIRGTDVKFAGIVSEDDTMNYINDTIIAQNKKLFDEKVELIKELFGVDASNLSKEQLNELVDLISGTQPVTKYNDATVRDKIRKAFDMYSTLIKQMLSTGKDPFTDEDVEFTESQKKIIREFMSMNLDLLDAREGLSAVDGLVNFIQNKSTAKMEAVVRQYTGEKNARELARKGVKSSQIRKYWSPAIGRFLAEQVTNLNVLFERMFKGFTIGGMVEDMMGISALKNGKSKGQSESNRIVKDYVDTFYKLEANGEKFNTAYNAIERGMASFMTRNIVGTEAEMNAEFNRRKGLIEQSIAALSQGNQSEVEKANLYQQAYDKILSESNNIDDVVSKVDEINMEAVEFWRNQWASKYDQLADVSLNVYNKILEKDINYVPDKFTKLSSDTGPVDISTDDMAFHSNNGTIYKKETGVLMSATRPDALPLNPKSKEASMYIDLSFDKNNANAMYDALVDINTAGAIRQVEAFLNSSSFRKIVPQAEDAKILKDRVKLFVNNVRNKNPYDNDELSSAVRKLNKIAAIGVGQALGGIFQPIKQIIPVAMNTLINANFNLDVKSIFDKSKNNFINNSGYAIANRGIESQAQVDSLNKMIDEAATSKGEKLVKLIENANKWWLKNFLANADVFIARMSWMTYYEQSLKKQGIDPNTIDYNTHQLNEEAANYAQRQVDRQQNISDIDLAGKLLSDKEPTKQVFIKMLMPFASFRMNQSARLGSDLATLFSNTSTAEDKKIAFRSVSGFGVETATFRMLSAGLTLLMYNVVDSLIGVGDDDEEDVTSPTYLLDRLLKSEEDEKKKEVKEKKKDNLIKGQLTSVVSDVLSPLPLLDKLVQAGSSYALDKVQDAIGVADDDKLEIYSGTKQEFIQSLGLFGIAADRASQLYELADLAINGEFVDDYGRDKELSEDNMKTLRYLIAPAILSNIGLAPTEVNTIIRNSIKQAKYNAKTPMTEEDKIEKELLQGYKSRSDMKKYDPELYEIVFGENGMESRLLPKKVSDREAKKVLNKLRSALKDEYYNYQPRTKERKKKGSFGSIEFGGKEFGKQKRGKGFGEGSTFGSRQFGQ